MGLLLIIYQGAFILSVADELLKANQDFARNFTLGELSVRPSVTLLSWLAWTHASCSNTAWG